MTVRCRLGSPSSTPPPASHEVLPASWLLRPQTQRAGKRAYEIVGSGWRQSARAKTFAARGTEKVHGLGSSERACRALNCASTRAPYKRVHMGKREKKGKKTPSVTSHDSPVQLQPVQPCFGLSPPPSRSVLRPRENTTTSLVAFAVSRAYRDRCTEEAAHSPTRMSFGPNRWFARNSSPSTLEGATSLWRGRER